MILDEEGSAAEHAIGGMINFPQRASDVSGFPDENYRTSYTAEGLLLGNNSDMSIIKQQNEKELTFKKNQRMFQSGETQQYSNYGGSSVSGGLPGMSQTINPDAYTSHDQIVNKSAMLD